MGASWEGVKYVLLPGFVFGIRDNIRKCLEVYKCVKKKVLKILVFCLLEKI